MWSKALYPYGVAVAPVPVSMSDMPAVAGSAVMSTVAGTGVIPGINAAPGTDAIAEEVAAGT